MRKLANMTGNNQSRKTIEGVSYLDVGRRIRTLREANKYNREEFAEEIDISSKFLYEIELGRKGFSVETLHKISNALSVSSDYILDGKEKNKIPEEIADILECFSPEQMKSLIGILTLVCDLSGRKG